MENVDAIQKIRELLSDESCWIQDYLAVNDEWEIIDSAQEDACRWCLVGALDYVCFCESLNMGQWNEIYNTILKYTDHKDLTNFNDDRETTHDNVLSLLDNCIELESS